jgi:hypothetical protein
MQFKSGLIACAVVAAAVLLGASGLHAQSGPQVHAGRTVMNGYSLSQFPDFIKKWHFVTVRYRKDTGEMRLTYANDKAWKVLREGKTDYPDGAVFAKIGIATRDDPAFTSSLVPSGAKRYQLMVKDSKKHKDTDGWGYALFDVGGRTFEEDPEKQTAACHACHQLVEDRGYVFSQPMVLEVGGPAVDMPISQSQPSGMGKIEYKTKKIADLPPIVRRAVPDQFRRVQVIDHPSLEKSLFQGTIDEIRPALGKEALRAKMPAVLINEERTRFSMVTPLVKEEPCTLEDGKEGVSMQAIYTIKPGPEENYPIASLNYCEPNPSP